jgi:WXXGXW repeat (2 copies)
MRSAVLLLAVVLVIGLMSEVALAHEAVSGVTAISPPKPIHEIDPGKRPGYVLSPGYWRWEHGKHIWTPNRWIKMRDGYVWKPEQWEQRGDTWHLAAGHWVEDESYEDAPLEEPPIAHAKPKKKALKRRINYRDPVKWPRPTRR